jgi:predicted AAA+ superfamily ATPase
VEIATLFDVISESSIIGTQQVRVERSYFPVLASVAIKDTPLKVLTGIRRSGKSFQLKLLCHKLISDGIPPQNILFLNFENDRLRPYLSLDGIREIFSLFKKHTDSEKPVYLFFDEIQLVDQWEAFVRTQYDTGKYTIFITGSNSKLLSSEFSSALGGRVLEFFIQPFSFKERCQHSSITIDTIFNQAQAREEIELLFDGYLSSGGFTEAFALDEQILPSYKESLIEKIIIQDIVSRYEVQNISLLRAILQYFQHAAGTLLSVRNVAKLTKSTERTVSDYISYLCSSFIFLSLEKYAYKAKTVLSTQRKIYLMDVLFCTNADRSQKLENVILLELIRRFGKQNVFFGRDERGREIDFIVQSSTGVRLAIQVCQDLTDENFNREINSLEIMKTYDKNHEFQYLMVYEKNRLQFKKIPPFITSQHIINFLLPPTK